MMTGAEETSEEVIVRDHDSANSCVEEAEATAEGVETALGVEENRRSVSGLPESIGCL